MHRIVANTQFLRVSKTNRNNTATTATKDMKRLTEMSAVFIYKNEGRGCLCGYQNQIKNAKTKNRRKPGKENV